MAVGFKQALNVMYRFPALLLTSVFSIWSIGPASLKTFWKCGESKNKFLRISFRLTWVNLIITSIGLIVIMFQVSLDTKEHWNNFFHGSGNDPPSGFLSVLLLMVSYITLIAIQISPMFEEHCCLSCQKKCYPMIRRTVLDVEKPFDLIDWPLPDNSVELHETENKPTV